MKSLIIIWFFFSLLYPNESIQKIYFKSKSDNYQPINHTQYKQAVKCFTDIFNEDLSNKKALQLLGLSIVKRDNDIIILSDKRKNGQGFYMIRYKNPSFSQNMLSIPHRFYDIHTGNIGYKLMREHTYRAIAFNTVHRNIMDAAHTSQTLFNAFHSAFALLFQSESIYQLHGFSEKKHHNLLTKKSQIVVSSTDRIPTNKAKKIHTCFIKEGYNSLLYGQDVFELGGNTNTQAQTIKSNGFNNFIHIEFNMPLREALKNNATSRQKLIRCLP